MEIKESVVYQIIAKGSGKALCLMKDDSANGSYRVSLEEKAQNPLQGWVFAKISDNTYQIYPYSAHNVLLTDPSGNPSLVLNPKGNSTNQIWELVLKGDDVFQLLVDQDANNRNKLAEGRDGRVITKYYRDSYDDMPQFDLWRIEETNLGSIPKLNAGEGVNLTMGPTDHSIYIKPIGIKKAVMVFIDFPDTKKRREDDNTPALNIESAQKMSKHLLGEDGQAKDIFKTQSHQKFDLDITVKSDLGWKLLTKDSSAYLTPDNNPDTTDWVDMGKLVDDVKTLFKEDIKFDEYDMTLIVQPQIASTLNVNSSYGFSPSYTVLNVIAFGADSYRNRYVNLVHEVGHQIGLPDLYPYGDNGSKLSDDFRNAGVVHPVGCWSIMADMQHSESFLGWERHKMGWLDDARKLYLPELPTTPLRVTLNPLTDSSGISMIVMPLGNAENLSKVFVIEIGQDIYGVKKDTDGKLVRDGTVSDKKGVLLYTVDSKVNSGEFPIMIIPKTISKSDSDQYGQLFEAAYSDKDSKTYKDDQANVDIKIDVYKNEDSTYTVDIVKNPQKPPF